MQSCIKYSTSKYQYQYQQSKYQYKYQYFSVVAYGNDRYTLAQSTKFGTCIA